MQSKLERVLTDYIWLQELDIRNNNYTEEQILNFMIKDHNLIQRPIVEMGERAVLGRPIEKIKELF